MTAIIGFNLGSYALLLADTRMGNLADEGARRDGEQKISRVGFGMVSGAGSPAMIRAVVKQTLKFGLRPQDIARPMRAYREHVKVDVPDLGGPALNSLEQTRMITTTVERAPSGLAVAQVAVVVPIVDGDFGWDELEIGDVRICGPTPDEAWEGWLARCRQELMLPRTVKIERTEQPEELIGNVMTHIRLAAEVMAEIAACNPAVSPSFTVGVQYSPTDVRISGTLNAVGDSAWLR